MYTDIYTRTTVDTDARHASTHTRTHRYKPSNTSDLGVAQILQVMLVQVHTEVRYGARLTYPDMLRMLEEADGTLSRLAADQVRRDGADTAKLNHPLTTQHYAHNSARTHNHQTHSAFRTIRCG